MVPLVWDEQNHGILEFCQSDAAYGYRVPSSDDACGAAGVILRVRPGQNYTLTVRNLSQEPTNIHFHGLHANADDIRMFVDPSMCLTYQLEIPMHHAGGTFWMHSHQHPLTERQVSGGAYALLIVEEHPRLLEHVAEEDREVLYKWLQPENERLLLVSKSWSGDSLANGEKAHTMHLEKDRWYRLRVAAVDASDQRTTLDFPSSCQAHIVAYDGMWRRQVPHPDTTPEHSFTGSSRVDFAFRCSFLGEYEFLYGNEKVATVLVREGSRSDRSPFLPNQQPWRPWKPSYLRDMTDYDSNLFETYTVRALDDGVNGRMFDPETPLRQIDLDSLQEWQLKYTNWHPFHLHTFPMQTFGCEGHEDGEFYDTVMSTNEVCTVRFRAVDFTGDILFHCHVLAHSDAGSMAYLQVLSQNVGATTQKVNQSQFNCASILP